MSTHNICFYGEIMKIIPKLSSNTLLICSTTGTLPFPYVFASQTEYQTVCSTVYTGLDHSGRCSVVYSSQYGPGYAAWLAHCCTASWSSTNTEKIQSQLHVHVRLYKTYLSRNITKPTK